jgi:hypothetical protein
VDAPLLIVVLACHHHVVVWLAFDGCLCLFVSM